MRIRWRGLELPTRLVRDEDASRGNYGRFIVEPFERGFGTTVGNSIRRILLSSLQGAAVTHVKIKGADHEFMSLPGVYEDVTEIILNIKSLIIKSTSDHPKTMKVSAKGKSGQMKKVTAADIEADPALEIINQDQLLATLTNDIEFEMEMTVSCGRSYVTAEENKTPLEDQIIGVIPVDSVFSPVTRVRYRVEDTRVGQRTNYDRLVMEIWTNGTVTPEMALVEAAKILRKHLNPFVMYFELGGALAVNDSSQKISDVAPSPQSSENDDKLAMPISVLDLSVRASNCLTSANINTIGDLIKLDEAYLIKLRSFGRTSMREVKRKLADHGLALIPSDEAELMSLDPHHAGGFSASDEEDDIPRSSPTGIPPLDSGTMGNQPLQNYSTPMPSPEPSEAPSTDSAEDNRVGIAPEETG